ncbi:RDD family protein [Shimia ponticola]|uniref:RDD family protein n=1 Tax=Shimia ponticola TaxID=2582893 RepID=UPI0011BDCADB|nr:RDD family protein [Shimia ponticola]
MAYTDPYAALPDPELNKGFYADVPIKRLLAFILDLCIILMLSLVVAFLTFGLGFFVFFAIFGIVGFTYRVLSIASGSATWGMRMMAIELRTQRGERLTLFEAVLHTVGFYVSFAVTPIQLISVFLMLTTPRGQGLTDMLFGTVALNRRGNY